MRRGEFLLYEVAYFHCTTLALEYRVPEVLFRLAVTHLTGIVDACQWAADMVAAVLDAPFRYVRHVAIGARNPSLRVDARLEYLVVGVLRLDNGCLAQRVRVVGKPDAVVILLRPLHDGAVMPGDDQVFHFGR